MTHAVSPERIQELRTAFGLAEPIAKTAQIHKQAKKPSLGELLDATVPPKKTPIRDLAGGLIDKAKKPIDTLKTVGRRPGEIVSDFNYGRQAGQAGFDVTAPTGGTVPKSIKAGNVYGKVTKSPDVGELSKTKGGKAVLGGSVLATSYAGKKVGEKLSPTGLVSDYETPDADKNRRIQSTPRTSVWKELLEEIKNNQELQAGAAGALAGGLGGWALGSRMGSGIIGAAGGALTGAGLAAMLAKYIKEREKKKA